MLVPVPGLGLYIKIITKRTNWHIHQHASEQLYKVIKCNYDHYHYFRIIIMMIVYMYGISNLL